MKKLYVAFWIVTAIAMYSAIYIYENRESISVWWKILYDLCPLVSVLWLVLGFFSLSEIMKED